MTKGYVMVSLHDMCTVNEDGTVSPGKIMLPPGKRHLSFHRTMSVTIIIWMVMAWQTKLIVDENGDIKMNIKKMTEVYQ